MNSVRTGRGSNLEAAAVLFAIITIGFSQIIYNLVSVNPVAFSAGFRFIFWTLLWIQIFPFFILFSVDYFFRCRVSVATPFYVWRTVLYGMFAISLLRQFQVFHADTAKYFSGSLKASWIYPVFFLIALLLIWRTRKFIDRYLAFLGAFSIVLPVLFIYQLRAVAQNSSVPPKSYTASCADHFPPITVIIFDELSMKIMTNGDAIDARFFPNFSALSKDAIWFTNTTTNHWSTIHSLRTLLTGRIHPGKNDRTLLEFLPRDYRTTVMLSEIEVENWLRYQNQSGAIDSWMGKDHFVNTDPFSAGKFLGYRLLGFLFFSNPANILFDDPEYHATLNREMQYVQSLNIRDREFLLWHVSVPHSPFLFAADGSRHYRQESFFPFAEEYRPDQFRGIIQNYRWQVQYADWILGEFIAELKESGAYDRAILIVTSDHGVRVWGNLFRHVDLIADIPLLIRAPGKEPKIISTDTQLSDLAPTILDLLSCQYPVSGFDGRSVFSGNNAIRDKKVYFHPAKLQYVWNRDRGEWENPDSIIKGALAQKFSTMMLLDDVLFARETEQDFLTLYLSRHFPKMVTPEDISDLKKGIESISDLSDNVQNNFRKGMYYFFLALAGSMLSAKGKAIDPSEVNEQWHKSLNYLMESGSIQPWIAEEVAALIRSSDTDKDGTLNKQELQQMILSRPSESF